MSDVNRVCDTNVSDTANPFERGFRAPFNGKIISIGLAVNVAVTTGRAIGYTEKATPSALYTFREGQYISLVGDGGGDAGNCSVTFDLQQD